MKKNYNIPATEVVAFKSEAMIMAGSPVGPTPGPTPGLPPVDPNGSSTAIGGGHEG